MQRPKKIVLAGGWGPRGFCGYLSRALDDWGHDSLIIRSPRHGETQAIGSDESGLPWTIRRLARSMNDQTADVTAPQIVFANSLGCLTALAAAVINPGQLPEAIVLVNPPFMRQDDYPSLKQRSTNKTAHSIRLAREDRSLRRATRASLWWNFWYGAANPRLALAEAHALADFRHIAELVEDVRERGVKVYAVLAKDDRIFPVAECEWMAAHLDGMESIDGQHDLWYNPQALILVIGRLLTSTFGPELFAPVRRDALCVAPAGYACLELGGKLRY